ncbi:hypothetical protein [Arthrobacter sp. HLT1-20]
MTNQQPGPAVVEENRRWTKKIMVVVLVGALALAAWAIAAALGGTPAGNDVGLAGTQSQQATPSTSASGSAAANPSAPPSPSPPAQSGAPEPAKTPAAVIPSKSPAEVTKEAALAAVAQPIAAPVPLDKVVTVEPGLDVKVSNIAAVDGVAQGVGEIAGPSIQFTVVVVNNSGQDVPGNNIAVTVEFGKDKSPAVQLSGPGTVAFPAVIANKQTATATFVFNVPLDQRQQVRILTSLNASSPIAAFEGAVSVSKGTP